MSDTIPSDVDLAALEVDSYADQPKGEVYDFGPDRAVITRLAAFDVLSIAGTRNMAGWVSDFEVAPATLWDHPTVGPVEKGFGEGAEALWPILRPRLGERRLIMQGHSRGAPIMAILCRFLLDDGLFPVRCVAYEMPWGVGAPCRDSILAAGIDGITYWTGNDPVPSEPNVSWLVPNVWPIQRIGAPRLLSIECHYMASVLAALTAALVPA